MNIDFNSRETNLENNKEEGRENDFISKFIKELGQELQKFINKNDNKELVEGTKYVVRDMNDEKASLVNIENGDEIDINAKLISKEDIDLGSAIIVKDGKYEPYDGEIQIKNKEAYAKLEEMYFNIEQEKGAVYSVSNITEEKIFLTDTKEGGYFSIPRNKYPNFKEGDLVKKEKGKYILV